MIAPLTIALTLAEVLPRLHGVVGAVPTEPALFVTRTVDGARCGGESVVISRDRSMAAIDPMLVAAADIESPPWSMLDDLPTWLAIERVPLRIAVVYYTRRFETSKGRAKLEAAARRVLVQQRFLDAILHAAPPSSVGRAGLPAYCDGLATGLEIQIEQLDRDMAACRKVASDEGLSTGWWTEVCKAP